MGARTYGSEYHLFRYRRQHTEELDTTIQNAVGVSSPMQWVYPADPSHPGSEPEGLGFIPEARSEWKMFWPQRGSQQCWDGIAKINEGERTPTWLLMEAKANHPEFTGSPCGARTGSDARKLIEHSLGRVKSHLRVHRDFSWMGSYYQYANRLAALYFLRQNKIPARLVFIYFTGDCFADRRPCPADEPRWHELFKARQLTLGLPEAHPLLDHVHHVFLDANPPRR